MSLVDDLHEAEDTIGRATGMLRAAARDVHLMHARQSYEEGGVWACGGDECGCPAEHPPSHNAETDPVARLTS